MSENSGVGIYNPICDKSLLAFAELLKTVEELERAKIRYDYLKAVIKNAQEELSKEYGVGYITRKKVNKSRFPIFRSIKAGKDYNLERNFPELAKTVNEYFDIRKRIKELEAKRKKLNNFIDMAYVICVPPEVRDPKKAYKERRYLKAIAYVSEAEESLTEECKDGDKEACENLKALEECVAKGFRVEGKRIICDSFNSIVD